MMHDEAMRDFSVRRGPRYTGKNRYSAAYDELYDTFTVKIELDLMDDIDEPPRTSKEYWRNAQHNHWIEEYSGKVVAKDRNGALFVILEQMVASLRPAPMMLDAAKAQIKKAR